MQIQDTRELRRGDIRYPFGDAETITLAFANPLEFYLKNNKTFVECASVTDATTLNASFYNLLQKGSSYKNINV